MKKPVFSFISEFVVVVMLLFIANCCNDDSHVPSPVITSVDRTSGVIGTFVTIHGDRFIPTVPPEEGSGPFPNTSIVTFNGTVAEAEYVYQDSIGKQRINTKVPVGATSGKITVTVNGITVSSLDDFNVTVPNYLPNVEVTTVPGWGYDVALDSEGSLYTTRKEPSEIVKITADGNVHTLWSSASERPWGVVVDAAGNVFATVTVGSSIIKISADGIITTLAGSNVVGFADGQGASARFKFPLGIALDKDGNLYIADWLNFKIRKITPDGTVSTLAGSTPGYRDGSGSNAQFESPGDVAVDGEGNVYVTDRARVRKITSGGQVSTIAGGAYGYLDGTTANAQFGGLDGIVIDTIGNIYVCDQGNAAVRRIAPDGSVVTVAGSVFGNLDGPGSSAQFGVLLGITMDASGAIYLAQADAPFRKIVIH